MVVASREDLEIARQVEGLEVRAGVDVGPVLSVPAPRIQQQRAPGRE